MNQIKKKLNLANITNNQNNISSENNSYTINYNSKIYSDIIDQNKINENEQYQINMQNIKNNYNDLAENDIINDNKNLTFEIEQNFSINKNNNPNNISNRNKVLNFNNYNNNQKYNESSEEKKIISIQKYEQLIKKIEDLQKQKQKLEQDIKNEIEDNKIIKINNEKNIPFNLGKYSEFKEYEKKILNNVEIIPYSMENNRDILGEFVDKVIERSYHVYKNRYCNTCAKLLSNGQSTRRCPKNHHKFKNNQK